MRLFTCQACGQTLFFENLRCERCGRGLGFLPEEGILSAVEPVDGGFAALAAPGRPFRRCANAELGACNWLVAVEEGSYCRCCAHNRMIPDLSDQGRVGQWRRIEEAKRRLFYSILQMRLPAPTAASGDPEPLVFDFLADPLAGHRVLTGHENGLITIALSEADDSERERVRAAMGEPYRTLLGHFRHEIGHYYWDLLIAPDAAALDEFTTLFGDSTLPYGEAVTAYYAAGPASDWNTRFVSAYASLHPWEDWAESWAHYFHIVDTLEMARSLGLGLTGPLGAAPATPADPPPFASVPVPALLADWLPLALAVNSLNRCMGQPDFYPFVLPGPVVGKIDFIHRVVSGRTAAS